MKLSEHTTSVLKNFASINQNLVIKEGKTISTMSAMKNIVAKAEVDEDFPREIGIEKYIDYDLQFEKSFLDPLKIILDVIQWNVEKTASLESFFS